MALLAIDQLLPTPSKAMEVHQREQEIDLKCDGYSISHFNEWVCWHAFYFRARYRLPLLQMLSSQGLLQNEELVSEYWGFPQQAIGDL